MLFPNIEAERIRRQIPKDTFAAEMGVSRRTITNWQNGTTEIPLSALVKLSRLWGVSADYLLGLTDTSN